MRRFHSISEFHAFAGLPKPQHPLLSVVNVGALPPPPPDQEPESLVLDFYAFSVKRMRNVQVRYGQHPFDFQEGVLSFLAPGQVFRVAVVDEAHTLERSGWVVNVHPDFLWHTPLAATIRQFDFWDYSLQEALFLSAREEATILGLLQVMNQEYQATIDQFSKPILVSHLENLLRYADRFYHRQFLTREPAHHEVLARVTTLLRTHFEGDDLAERGLPTVQYVADCLHFSPKYLSSILRVLTGQTMQQHIHEALLAKAKEQLSVTSLTVSEIASQLGFEHVPSFSKLFKAKTGRTPLAFRASFH